MQAIELRTIAKISRRIVPFLIICYFVAYLDRVNVGFAALTIPAQMIAVRRGLWHLRLPAGFLDAAPRLPVRRRGGCRDCRNQFDRQPRGFRRAVCHGLDQGQTGSYAGGLLLLAGLGVLAMGIVLMLGHNEALEHAPAAE